MKIRGNHGTFKVSYVSKDAPLIFIVGGLTMPKNGKGATVPPNYYPGDLIASRKGYMWHWKNYGFEALTSYNIYNCFVYNNSVEAWKDCELILKQNNIKPKKFILVGFSAGVGEVHKDSGLLNYIDPNKFDVICLAGAFLKGDYGNKLTEKITKTINTVGKDKVYYFTSGSLDLNSEGAEVKYKKVIANKLDSSHVITKATNHGEQIKYLTQFIVNEVPVSWTMDRVQPFSNASAFYSIAFIFFALYGYLKKCI
jgi:hypothetical protein